MTIELSSSAVPPERRQDEGDLLLRHCGGDGEAFAELVAEYRAPVYSYLARCGVEPDDRDDLFQDVFIKIHRAARRYRRGRPLHPWVFTIVANTVRNHFRKQRVRELVFSPPRPKEPTDPRPDGAATAEARQTANWLEGEIRRLPVAQRQVLLLASVECMPLKEVAKSLQIPLNTVKTRLHRARVALIGARARRQQSAKGEVSS